MITLEFGTIEAVKPPRVDVRLLSYNGESTIKNALVLSCGGQSTAGTASWVNFAPGDVVACLVDDERPENALILGGVYGDAQTVPDGAGVGVSSAGDVKIKALSVWLGQSVAAPSAVKTCRDPLVQSELEKIKAVLNGLISSYNLHTHSIMVMNPGDSAAIVASATSGSPAPLTSCSTIPTTSSQGATYDPGDTASNSVYVD